MPLRKTLLVGAIFVLLGSYIYFFELPKGDKEKRQPLFSFKQEDVESITLTYPGQEIQLKRDDAGKWRMTHPLQASGDESTVSGILSALSTTEVKRVVEEKAGPTELTNFGLDKPQVRVAIGLKRGGSLPPLLVGAKTPVGNSTYVKRETEPSVLLTGALLSPTFEKKLFDFRDKRIMELKENDVKQLTLKGSQGAFVLTKKSEEWLIDKPSSYRADQTEVKGMLASLGSMFTRDFLEGAGPEQKKYGLDHPRLQILLDMGEKEGRREVRFGSKREGKDEVYVALDSGGPVYTVPESIFKGLDKNLTALRDKQILSFAPEQVAKLQISHGPNDSIVLFKGPKVEWIEEASKPAEIQQRAVGDYLTALSALRAKGFAEDEPKEIKKYGLAPPSLKVSLEGKDAKNLDTLLVGQSSQGYYAKREARSTVYAIDELSYKQINKRRDDFVVERKGSPPSGVTKN
ncbi:MAG: DUF4340 domain-containing protein [Deltaproteobacteria bacterium]|nr:MAG: DUF4340 domain-containing protein [Deltaproteobacteria bacterium]